MKKIITLIALSLNLIGQAQVDKIDINELLAETQISGGESGEISIVWWIPVEFWIGSFQSDQSVSQNDLDEIIDILEPYSMFAIIDGEMGPFGGMTYTTFDSISKSIELVGSDNKTYKPIDENQLNFDVQNLLSSFKPILQNMMGNMGANMHFFVFDDYNKKSRIANPLKEGRIKINVIGKKIEWRTPLASLVPKKVCPVDNKKLNGTWKFCPYHGNELLDDK